MEYTLDYLLESFPKAARHLAAGEGDARQRVWLAYLAIHHLQPERLPEGLRKDFEWVMKQLTKRNPERRSLVRHDGLLYDEGLIEANLRTMQNRTASRIADRIFTMYEKVLGMACEPRPGVYLPFPR